MKASPTPLTLVPADEGRRRYVVELLEKSLARAKDGQLDTVIIVEARSDTSYAVCHAGKDELGYRLGLLHIAAYELSKVISGH